MRVKEVIIYFSIRNVVIFWVWIKCFKLYLAGIELIFRIIEEIIDICFSLKYIVIFN